MKKSDEEYSTLYNPQQSPAPEQDVIIVKNCSVPDWLATLLLWQRYRDISPLEKGFILNLINNEQQLPSLLNIPNSEDWLECYRLLPDLPGKMADRIHNLDISVKLIKHLLEIPTRLRRKLFEKIGDKKIHLTVQQARRLGEAVRSLKKLSGGEWEEILLKSSEGSNSHQAGEQLLKKIETRAYPETSATRRRFKKRLTDSGVSNKIKVSPPPNFEGDYLDFKFRWHRDVEVEKIIEQIKRCQSLLDFV
ncbi:MAG: hypothetical protein ACLFN5_06185 [bacterium]